MTIKPLTREGYINFDGSPPSVTMRGLMLTHENKVLAIIAVAVFVGQSFVICGTKGYRNKRKIIEGWREFKKIFMTGDRPYYALMDSEISTAQTLLKHVGFELLKDDIYIYRG